MKKQLIALFHSVGRSLSFREISGHFKAGSRRRKELTALLEELVAQGDLVALRGGRYALPRETDSLRGGLSLHRDGYGFVVPVGAGEDVFIPEKCLGGGMDGDQVEVAIRRGRRGVSREGRVVKVLERSVTELVGVFRSGRKQGLFVPLQRKEKAVYEVSRGKGAGAENGQLVVGQIERYPFEELPGRVKVVRVLGEQQDPEVEVLATAYRFGLPSEFSAAALSEAAAIPTTVTAEEWAGRRDLRDELFVTIDGETARDFDDAVALRQQDDGWRLLVAIADVAHYVTRGTALDSDALERGTSVYFPGSCLPMLPEALSNGICSLNPGVDRLVMVAELSFDGQGKRLDAQFYPAVIKSHGRLTYTQVQEYFDCGTRWSSGPEAGFAQLEHMAELARLLLTRRQARGCLDFDLPEARITLDAAGKTSAIDKLERLFAHRLIEEFMLAANEAVAAHLESEGRQLLFRIHESPLQQKLEDFQQFVAHFNHGFKLDSEGVDPHELQRLLGDVAGQPEEKAINLLLLRTMKQASYQADNLGHFGLAAKSYCHFTSPIRRYPDLVVHRVLQGSLRGHSAYRRTELVELGEGLSSKERRAMEAERDLVSLRKCQFMAGKVGESFTGTISSVRPFGLFVELDEVYVEGLVHISSMNDDYYHYEEELLRLVGYNRRRIFQIGDHLEVRLDRVNLEDREIDFVLDEADGRAIGRRPKGRR